MIQEYYTTNKRKGKHICIWERKKIEKALQAGASISSIARMLNRNKSSISREVKRGTVTQRKKKSYEPIKKEHRENWLPYTQIQIYKATSGERVAVANKSMRGGKYKLFNDTNLIRHIEHEILVNKYSPDGIIGGLKVNGHNFKTMICTKTLYNYIDRCQLAVRNIDLVLKTRLGLKQAVIRKNKRIFGESIELRPKEVDDRQEFGHWEADSIKGKNNQSSTLTLTERKTNKSFILQVDTMQASSAIKSLELLLVDCGLHSLFKTITLDNGSEFADCHKLKEKYGIQTYFAHPYSAYERGINENYNGIIRRYIPKGKDISTLSQKDLNRIANLIDDMPRKRHGYKSAKQMFDLELQKFTN